MTDGRELLAWKGRAKDERLIHATSLLVHPSTPIDTKLYLTLVKG